MRGSRGGEDSIFDLKVNLERRARAQRVVLTIFWCYWMWASCPAMGAALAKDKVRDRLQGDEVAAKFGSGLGITKRQLEVLASSLMPTATSGHIASVRASVSVHAGLRSISNSTLDFDKVGLEEQQADWHGADDLLLSCWWPCHAQHWAPHR